MLLAGASVITAAVAAMRAGSDATLLGLAALGAVLLAVFGRLKLNAAADARATDVGSGRFRRFCRATCCSAPAS